MKLPHSFICFVARGGKSGVADLEFFLFLLRVAVRLCHAYAGYRAFDRCIYLGESAAAFAKGADLLFAQQSREDEQQRHACEDYQRQRQIDAHQIYK